MPKTVITSSGLNHQKLKELRAELSKEMRRPPSPPVRQGSSGPLGRILSTSTG